MMSLMKLIDTHAHFWDLTLQKNQWLLGENHDSGFLGNYDAICQNYLPKNLIQDSQPHELSGMVHIQAGWSRQDQTGETQFIQCLEDQIDKPIACIAYTDTTSPDLEKNFEAHQKYSCLRAFRQTINWHENPVFCDAEQDYVNLPQFHHGLKVLNQYNTIFEVQAYSTQIEKLLSTINHCSNITFVIEHCGLPIFKNAKDFAHWQATIKQLNQLDNVRLKISGLNLCMRHNSNQFSKAQLLDDLFTHYSIERMIFGSNFPVESLYASYDQIVQDILNIGPNKQERQTLFYDNAKRVYHPTLVN